jgi:hypothetical protein
MNEPSFQVLEVTMDAEIRIRWESDRTQHALSYVILSLVARRDTQLHLPVSISFVLHSSPYVLLI